MLFSDYSNRFTYHDIASAERAQRGDTIIDFATGSPNPADIPDDLLRKVSIEAFESREFDGQPESPIEGFEELRALLAEHMRARGVQCGVRNVMVLSGSEQGIDLIVRAFINPGDCVHTLTNIRKIVSGMDEESAREIQKIYNIVIKAGTFPVSTIKTAEAVKVIENSQRDINIAFMNEVAKICDRMGIDTDEVLAGMNTKWNALGFRPGLVGGHCIGVDPYYLTNAAEALGYHRQIILNGRKVNDSMGAFVADAAIKQMIEAGKAPKKATVVILGITFKENCPDTRNSKVVDIIDRLREYDIQPTVADPWADAEVAKQVYGVDLVPFDEIPKADCVIVAVGHGEFRALPLMELRELFTGELSNDERVLIDVKSLYRMDELKASGLRFWRL